MSPTSTKGPRIADPTNRIIDWLGARRPATVIVLVMAVAAAVTLIPSAFL